MNKKIAIIWLTIIVMVLRVFSGAGDGTVILHPGYITGTVSVTGETVTSGNIDAISLPLPSEFDAHTSATNGAFELVVEGGYDYSVTAEASLADSSHPDYNRNTFLSMGSQTAFVPMGTENTVTMDFSMDPGYIAPVVELTGGEITTMEFFATTNEGSYVDHIISKKGATSLDGTTSFPMHPWKSIDTNNDGDYKDYDVGDTSLELVAFIFTNSIKYRLPSQFINVTVGESTDVYWNLNIEPGSLSGSVIVEGEDIRSYYVSGYAYFDGTRVDYSTSQPGDQPYYVELPPGTWTAAPTMYFHYVDSTNYWDYNVLVGPGTTIPIGPNEDVVYDWYIVPGYVTGSIDFVGAHGNFKSFNLYASIGGWSIANRVGTNDYKFILTEGDWYIGYPYSFLYFDYGESDSKSNLLVRDYRIASQNPPITVTAGETVSDVDFTYHTATITVYFLVEGGGELHSPKLFASSSEGVHPNRIASNAESTGSNVPTTLGESTITVLNGSHIVGAYAIVGNSYTKFGEFTITVEPGDVIKQDIGAPTVDVVQPGGFEHTCESFVDVVGTTTDDVEVGSITVNETNVVFSTTNNPDDPNEVSFSSVVSDLVYGENTITIVVTDTSGNDIEVERTVIRDVCNLPPEIISITGPLDPVALDSSYEMQGVFTDPDPDDTHTAIWDWGDGTTSEGQVNQLIDTVTGSHDYASPGVYEITLTVVDAAGESDTMTWSQYLVVYDPSGGFVTGGGWIDSPPGAYTPDPTLTGKANFGFVSKYKKGTIVPTGSTEFQFKAGDINFHSDSYEWMLVSGEEAKIKGTGTINGEDSYKFLINTVDGTLGGSGSPDMFRIKIWKEDELTGEETVIYDSGSLVIGGGNITIHPG